MRRGSLAIAVRKSSLSGAALMKRSPVLLSFLGCLAGSTVSLAQLAPSAPAAPQTMHRLPGVWVEGPGYDVKYGADFNACAARCLAATKCVMIEYYRPEKKCNLYDGRRPTKPGGSSDVAVKAHQRN